ncbi:shikimate kinase [Aerococcus agrisoli]|uniref:Shikimate kinase n=1 Tax=Aerococcus agrisoli TaxID=2487350 RepID=A0A3N4GQC4_9LACT|nr:shikimate kinase [Aerococcus agrisoli]RPA61281.1 shikimate kinase [Aerococcus agrisoli]
MPIILTGFMGVGKTTVGRTLAEDLAVPFVDMDTYIEEQEGKSISDIFAEGGESLFRQIELGVLKKLLQNPELENAVISTGGGVVETAECRQLLKDQDQVFYMQDVFETSWRRISRHNPAKAQRPLVKVNTRKDMLAKYNRRIPLYLESATHTLDVQQSNAYQTAKTIQRYL